MDVECDISRGEQVERESTAMIERRCCSEVPLRHAAAFCKRHIHEWITTLVNWDEFIGNGNPTYRNRKDRNDREH